MIKVTLSLAQQNKLLPTFHHFNLSESFVQNLELLLHPTVFGEWMADVAQLENPPTLKQLKVEKVDLKQQPIRRVVKYRGHAYDAVDVVTK